MSSDSETVEEIVSDMYAYDSGEIADIWVHCFADRIEAAEKQSVTDCNRFGNAAKMPNVGYGDRFYVVPYKAMEVRP